MKVAARIKERSCGVARGVSWSGAFAWALGFVPIVYLGTSGGGYDPLVHDQVGIAVWWIVLCGVLVGALPRRRPEPLAWTALGLLAAFVLWTALSLGWTASAGRTSADLARVVTYLGVFAFALLLRGSRGARRTISGVGAGIAVLAVMALLSRMEPGWFPQARETARFLGGARERLSYPVDYWNGLAALTAMGLPLLLQVATSARFAASRALAAAALPALLLTSYLTISRAGIAAAACGLAVFLAFTSNRLPKLGTLAAAAAGGGLLILAAAGHDSFQHGLAGAAASSEGGEMLVAASCVCLMVGLLQLTATRALRGRTRPRWSQLSRRQSLAVVGVAAAALLVAAAAVDVGGHVTAAWGEFKGDGGPGEGSSRLSSAAGEQRYQYWSAAVDEVGTRPLSGTGSGTFELWWSRHGNGSVVRDTHSLYLQTLGELGIVGVLLLGGFLLCVLCGGVRRVLGAEQRARSQLAAALGSSAAFCLTAVFDWTWQIPVLPVALMLLASVLLTAGSRSRRSRGPGFSPPLRAGAAAVAIAAVIAIAIPLASASLLRESEASARSGDLTGALREARTAREAQPAAAAPRLQEALVLERLGEPGAAAAAAAATRRDAADWRPWFVLARLEAERGRVEEALRAFRRARLLDPHSPLFARGAP